MKHPRVTSRPILCSLGAIAVIALGVLGCGDDDGGGGGDDYSVSVVTGVAGDDFHHTIGLGAEEEGEALGVDVEVQHPPKFDPASQVPILDATIAKHPDAIIIGPTDKNALQAPIERAVDAGIEVVLFDTEIEDPSIAATFVSSDVEEAGRNVAEELARTTGEKGKVAYLDVFPGQTFFEDLRAGFEDEIANYPDIEVLPVQYNNFEEQKANSIVRTDLTTSPDLAGLFAIGGPPIAGALAALKESDKLDQVNMVVFDGYAANIEALKAGEIESIVSTKTLEYGAAAMQAAVDALNGEDVPERIDPGLCVMTAENVDDPENSDCVYEEAPK